MGPREDRDDMMSTRSRFTEFSEFKLRTANLHSIQRSQAKQEQIKQETSNQFAYKPFKARKLDDKMLQPRFCGPLPERLSMPAETSLP